MRLVYPALLAFVYTVPNNAQSTFGGLDVYVDFASFQCFTDSEVSGLNTTLLTGITLSDIQQQELDRIALAIGDWGLPGDAAAIIMKEMFKMPNITLIDFYEDAPKILTNSTYTDIMIPSHFELYPSDFDPAVWNKITSITGDLTDLLSGIEIFSGIYGKTEWLENPTIETAFDSECEYGEFWKAYENPDIIALMTQSSDVPNKKDDDGNYECSPEKFDNFNEYRCINGTFVPAQCKNESCSSIVGFTPYYDLGLFQSFLTDYNGINLDIKYIGDQETSSVYLNEYISSYDTLFAFWQPSIMVSSGQFKLIQMPPEYITDQMSQIHKLIPSDLNKISSFIYEFLELVKMTNVDYEWILNDTYSRYNGFNQTSYTRVEGACQWLRHVLLDEHHEYHDHVLTEPKDWIPTSTAIAMNSISCNDYTKTQLEKLMTLDNYDAAVLLTTLKYKNDENIEVMLDESGAKDILQAFRIKEKCYNATTIISSNMSTTMPATSQGEQKCECDDDDGDNTWMLVAIIFIILFVIAIIYIGYTCYAARKGDDGAKPPHSKVKSTDVEMEENENADTKGVDDDKEPTPPKDKEDDELL